MLTIPRTPTDDNKSTAFVVCADPLPKAPLVKDVTALSGFSEVKSRATKLADATDALIESLKRHKQPTKHATALTKGLRERTGRPTLRDHKTTRDLERQVLAIEQEIDRGVLTDEEDNRERIAYWWDKLRGIRTREGHERLAACVEEILSRPRKPDHELALLNHFAAERQREFLILPMEATRRATGSDTLSMCRRWQDLTAFGSRFFVRHIDNKSGISFRDVVRAHAFYKASGDSPQPLELEWAERLRGITESLRPLADAAGFTAGERTPITNLVQALGRVIDGKSIDFDSLAVPVQVLVDEIVAQASQSRHSIINRFNRLVIDLHADVTRTLKLIREHAANADLTLLDHYIINGKSDERDQGPGGMHDIEWRTVATSLTSNLKEALDLWTQETGSPARSLKHDFVLVGKSQAKLRGIHENSFHALVLRVARIFITPEAEGSVPQTVLDDIGLGPNNKPCHGVARLRLVREMLKSKWPAETTPELEREHVAALDLSGDSKTMQQSMNSDSSHSPQTGDYGASSSRPSRSRTGLQSKTNQDNPQAIPNRTRGSVSKERDAKAVIMAKDWDEKDVTWTQKDLARALDVERNQLFGKSQDLYRCPMLMSYWKQRQGEKEARKMSLRQHNRTRMASDDPDDV